MSSERIRSLELRLITGVAGVLLGATALRAGLSALETHIDVVELDAQARVYDGIGEPDEASVLRAEADTKEDDRNEKLVVGGMGLLATGVYMYTATRSRDVI